MDKVRTISDEAADRLRDEVVRRMADTPPNKGPRIKSAKLPPEPANAGKIGDKGQPD